MDDYEVTMLVKVKVYANDREDAIKQASRSHTNWDDWDFIREEKVVNLSDDPNI